MCFKVDLPSIQHETSLSTCRVIKLSIQLINKSVHSHKLNMYDIYDMLCWNYRRCLHIRGYTHMWCSTSEYGGLKYGSRSRSVDRVRKSLACEVPGGGTLCPCCRSQSFDGLEPDRVRCESGNAWRSVVNSHRASRNDNSQGALRTRAAKFEAATVESMNV